METSEFKSTEATSGRPNGGALCVATFGLLLVSESKNAKELLVVKALLSTNAANESLMVANQFFNW